ncbi:inositol 2-dehydrogenase [Thalassospira sp. MA62]|nr:inositol 2-dehydrogenase [Thalassospira sp. MA62]
MLKIGLLGAGRIGQVHAVNIVAHPRSELVAVSDKFDEAAQKLAAAYGAVVRSSEEILSDPTIDAVLIATSTDTHADLMEAATAAGKAVMCEKPVDLDLKRAVDCLARCAPYGKPVMVGFNRRFDPNFAALKTAFDQGEIGKGELLSITSFDPAPPPVSYVKVSGGIFRDMAIHDFDMACWIYGDLPEKVTAIGSSIVDPEIGAAGDFDTAITTLTFSGGRMAVIKNSRRAAYGYDQRIEFLGADGLLAAHNVLENTIEKITRVGATKAKPEHFFLERYAKAYQVEWNSFIEGVEGKADLPVTLKDGINALIVAEAAGLSAREGRTVDVAKEIAA